MENVTQLFIDSTNQRTIYSTFKAYVSKTKNGEVLTTLELNDIVSNGISLTSKSMSGQQFIIGGVNMGEMKINLTKQGIKKMKDNDLLQNKYCIHLVQWNKVDDVNQSTEDYSKNKDNTENTTGKCDLGYFYIAKIDNRDYNCNITCYDAIIATEENASNELLATLHNADEKKTPQEIVELVKEYCNTSWYQFDITIDDSCVNKDIQVCLDEDTNPNTYRDILGYLSILLGGFCISDENGNLKISSYRLNSSVETISENNLYDCLFDGTMSEIGSFYTSVAGYDFYKEYNVEEGLQDISISISENPFLRGIEDVGAEQLSETTVQALTNIADKFGGVKFIGGNATVAPKPYLQCGDVVKVKHIKVDVNNNIEVIEEQNVIICSVNNNLLNNLKLSSNSSIANSNVSSSAKTKKSSGSGGKTSSGGLTVMNKITDSDINLSASGVDVATISCYTSDGSDVLLTANLVVESSSDGDVEPIIESNGIPLPNTNKIRVFNGTYSYPHIVQLPEDMKQSGEPYTFKLSARGSGKLKKGSGLSVIAGGLRRSSTETSTPEYFNFQIDWLSLEAGLYDKDMNILSTWANLVSEGLAFQTGNSNLTNAAVLDAYGGTDNILVVDGRLFTATWAVGSYYSKTVGTLIIKNGVKIRTPFSRYATSMEDSYRYSLKRIFVSNDCTLYAATTRPWAGLSIDPYVTLYTDAKISDTTGFVGYQYWRYTIASGTAQFYPVYNISESTDFNYTVSGGADAAGLKFNEGDLKLLPGLYDSKNRLICDWDTLVEFGIGKVNETVTNDYTNNNRSGGYPINIIEIFNKATKIIVPSEITTVGDVQFSGSIDFGAVRGKSLKVVIFKGAVSLGRYSFGYNDQLSAVYLPQGSECPTTYAPFISSNSELKIYTDAVDDVDHTFGRAIKVIGYEQITNLTNDNIYYNN